MSDPAVAVLDTNILISGVLSRPSLIARALLQRFRESEFRVATSPELLAELLDVSSRPRLKRLIAPALLEALLVNLREDAFLVDPQTRPQVVLADPDDDALFACGVSAHAAFIVSSDSAVLAVSRFRNLSVVRPSEFLMWLDRRQK